MPSRLEVSELYDEGKLLSSRRIVMAFSRSGLVPTRVSVEEAMEVAIAEEDSL